MPSLGSLRWLLVLGGLAGCGAWGAGTPPVPAPPPTGPPPLFGFWGLNGKIDPEGLQDVKRRLGAEVFHTASRSPGYVLNGLLPLVRAADMKVSLRLTGGHPHHTGPGGDFDVAAWMAELQRWAPHAEALAPYIADGTLVTHMLLDDIHNYPGRSPTAAELDAMAAASKALLPGLATFVRERATEMPVYPDGRPYQHVDAIVHQYRVRFGEVQAWSDAQSALAAQLGLRVICGLNIANGGDGSSGQPGWREGRHAMSADEVRRYGSVLADDPRCSMFLAWEYDAEERWSDGSIGAAFFDRPENAAALRELGERVKQRPGAPLTREGRPARR
jgi:hypothetical protein